MNPQISQIVDDYTQPQPHLVRPEQVVAEPRHLHRLIVGNLEAMEMRSS